LPLAGFAALPSLRLHHAGILVRDIETAAARYVRRAGCRLRTEKLHDAVQTAYVQFLALPGDPTMLELVAPDGPESRLAGAAAKGGGLHHLCYATCDIEATGRDWREGGFFLIREPVPAVAFGGRRVAWLMSPEQVLVELVEQGREGEL
jgi:methylmalonyl-CoA/ethylmalonyl-CoA epimerase